jgi:integrase
VTYTRRLPSGLWQATVRGPDGRRHTHTDPLKGVVKKWAATQEAQLARGEFRDPRLGEIKVGDWQARVSRARGLESATKAKHATLWRAYCEPEWARWPMAAVTRMEAQEWVDRLPSSLSAATVTAAAHMMSGLYKLAMREHPPLVTVNPFARLDLPRPALRRVDFYEPGEAAELYAAAAGSWRTLIQLGMQTGLRTGEIFGLHGHRVDWLRSRVEVVDVVTRWGMREYPKSRRSHRIVPVPADVMESMSALTVGRPRDALVFTAPWGGPVGDVNFRNRIWNPAVRRAGVRQFPPRVMRHTAASWLVQDGVPLYDVQKLLGHESFATTERYAHLAPDAHGKVLDSWSRRRLDASVTHEAHRGEVPG